MLYKNITEITPAIIKTLITKSSTEHTRIKGLYERYKQTEAGVPILTRIYKIGDVVQKDKINNKLANDFVGEIIDMKVGFFCGVPISYVLDKTKYQVEKTVKNLVNKVKSVFTKDEPKTETTLNSKYDKDLEVINNFNKLNFIADLDVETAKRSSVCGYAGRLLYIELVDNKPVEKIKLIEPWECIFIGDSIERPTWTIRYYDTITYKIDGEEDKKSHAELYLKDKIEYYVKDDDGNYVIDPDKSATPHFWKAVPLFGFANNDEILGDSDKVLNLIDGYDKTTSDINSELEQFRLSYLKFKNCSISAEVIEKAKQTGAFSLPGNDTDADFITKNLNDAIIEHHLDRLERNIYRFSSTPNMNDITFGGNLTGIAMKFKFRPFEDKCKRSELKFKKSLQVQYELLCKVWGTKGIAIDPFDIDYIFTRNYPQNKIEEADFLYKTKGIISEETRFANSSLVEDPEKEIEKLKNEEQENLDNFIARNETLQKNAEKNNPEEKPEDDTLNSISNEAK